MNEQEDLARYVHCLSILEDKTSLLFGSLSERVDTPLIKSLLLSISKDSSKHSLLLKGIADSISDSKQDPKDCAKKLGEVWIILSNYFKEVNKEERISESDFSELLSKLDDLESSFGEEYYMFVQMKTLQRMAGMINKLYSINVESIKAVFESIIRDEDRHREILATIRDFIVGKSTEQDNTPEVKYQNPDSWIRPLPPTTYDSR